MCYNSCQYFRYINTAPGDEYCARGKNPCPESEEDVLECWNCCEELDEEDIEYGYCPLCQHKIGDADD